MEGAETETAVLMMTDVEASTRLWHERPAEMNRAMARHHEIVHSLVAAYGGWRPVDQGEGDAVFAAFPSARAAVAAAADVQRALAAEPWPPGVDLKVRIGIHAGDVIRRGGNLFGDTVNKCARIRGLGAGGQTLVSAVVHDQLAHRLVDGLSFVDLGEHRMKDLTRPERIHQLQVEGLPSDFPPLKGLDRARHNLPVQATTLVGRDADVAAVRDLLGQHRLVTLVGFGGVGKTRLALEVAAAVAEGDADGVWFVDLSTVTSPDLVPAQIAEVLGIKESAGVGAADAVLAELAGKRLLLVLDNLEHVLDSAPFVARVLARAPRVAILATSREPLRIQGEHEYAVATLPTPAAVELFSSRASAVRRDFELGPATSATVTEVCERLDGHPLAIELAAARMKVLTPGALLSRLDSALAVLTSGGRDRPERHQTLRSTIAWSYDALDDDERILLDRLSIFPGSMTFDAIEAVCAAPVRAGEPAIDALDVVMALVEKSLLRPLPATDDDPHPRYDLLGSVREFAAERLLASGGGGDIARRHAHFYADLNWLGASSATEGAALVQRVAQELHNFRAAFAWAQVSGSEWDEARFSTYLHVLVDAGHFEEARVSAMHALQRAPSPSAGRVRIWAALSYLYWHTGEHRLEREAMDRQVAEARRLGEPSLLAGAIIDSLQNAVARDELLALVEEADHLIASLPAAGNEIPLWFLLELRDNRMSIALRYVDPERAMASARGYYQNTQFDQFVAGAMIAQLAADRGDWDLAVEVLREIEEHAALRWVGDHVEEREDAGEGRYGVLQSMWLRLLAQVMGGRGDTARAVELAEQAVERVSRVELPHWSGLAHMTLGGCLYAAGRLEDAARELRTSTELLEGEGAGSALWRLARVERWLGRRDHARRLLTAAQDQLAGKELTNLADLLGALVEQAHDLADADPGAAVAALERVRRERGDLVLPLLAGEDVEPLLGAPAAADTDGR